MAIAQRFRRLTAIPSYHYAPIFAREVRRVFDRERPNAIALELPEGWTGELAWGLTCWPTPAVSYAAAQFLPIVPGDAIVEAYRLAIDRQIPLFCIDLDVAGPVARPKLNLPDAEFAPRWGATFLDAVTALDAAAGPPADADLAREATMAHRLAELMRQYDRVLWVGGMAHWARLRARLERSDFTGPIVPRHEGPRRAERMRLAASALYHMTGRLPFQVAEYAAAPDRYRDAAGLRKLAMAAINPEQLHAIDVALMLTYARNLAAQEGVRETPRLWNLLVSASSTLGQAYAGRLATLALQDHVSEAAGAYPALIHGLVGERIGYCTENRWLEGEPVWAVEHGRIVQLPAQAEIEERRMESPASSVKPADPTSARVWAAWPEDEAAYEAFVRFVLTHASALSGGETKTGPFLSGLGDGLDLRATIRHWHEGTVYIRERDREGLQITNGLIDFTGRHEDAAVLRGRRRPGSTSGWIDPDLLRVGSASREVRDARILQTEPFRLSVQHREVSLITLDAPTWVRGGSGRSFYDQVIARLIELPVSDDHLYGWLEVMFAFCRNKPFAYVSRYAPGRRVHELARRFGVRVVHVSLDRLPRTLVKRHRTFRFMHLTPAQRDELLERIGRHKRAWLPDTAEVHG